MQSDWNSCCSIRQKKSLLTMIRWQVVQRHNALAKRCVLMRWQRRDIAFQKQYDRACCAWTRVRRATWMEIRLDSTFRNSRVSRFLLVAVAHYVTTMVAVQSVAVWEVCASLLFLLLLVHWHQRVLAHRQNLRSAHCSILYANWR